MSLTVEVAAKTDVGCVRQNNEDNFGYDSARGIFVVCDGMGGMAAGEVASKMAVDAILAYFRGTAESERPPGDAATDGAQALTSAIVAANQAVHDSAQAHPGQAGMGSTVVALLVHGDSFTVGHVGDSRIYLVRNGGLQQLTNDHSLVMEQVRRGLITLEEARESDMQNIIIRALGSEESVQPDVAGMTACSGDVLLLCTDGLTRHVPDEKLLRVITGAPSLDAACEQLVASAKAAGGEDNVTCMLLRLVDQPWYRKIFPATDSKSQTST